MGLSEPESPGIRLLGWFSTLRPLLRCQEHFRCIRLPRKPAVINEVIARVLEADFAILRVGRRYSQEIALLAFSRDSFL
jgi:hypothetical protein